MPVKTFDVFGVLAPNLSACAEIVEKATGQRLALHNSAYKGGDYYRTTILGGDLTITNNYIQFTNTWTEDSFRDYQFLLSVDMADNPDELRATLVDRGRGAVVWLSRTLVDGRKMSTTTRNEHDERPN